MRSSSLESKTIRPGTYSFYHSDRRPMSSVYRQQPAKAPAKNKSRLLFTIVVVAVAVFGFSIFRNNASNNTVANNNSNKSIKSVPAVLSGNLTKDSKPAASENNCAGNTLDKMVLISISKRHAWACEKDKQVNDSAIISGMESVESTKTPVGTFKIYGKVKDTVLSGTDPTTGQWREPVSYWMPYHDNQYGTYGFHDAPWRQSSDFGNIDPNSMNGSHGCVQLPTNMAKWVYEWSEIGTTVIVKS